MGEDDISMKDDEAFARDRDEFERLLGDEPRRPPRRAMIAVAVAAVVVIGGGIALAVGLTGGGVSAAPGRVGSSASPGAGEPSSDASPGGTATGETPDGSAATPGTDSAEPDDPSTPAPDARETLPPADLAAPVTVDGGPTVSVRRIESVTGEAVLPGEVSGPAVRVTVEVKNGSTKPIDLTTAAVTLFAGSSDLQASPVTKPAGRAFPSEVAPGKTAEGAFVFELPEGQRADVRIEVDLSVSDPLIAFEGDID
ncbi:DUF4352 domain-containing protein [Microbacterium oleivorans]|uniref:DUF4352 domain-containing protein n=1 Tax=Microbacterium oleivorans TaxID=273677 RepID=A0A177K6M8_9MICO|nr:DUF4352 domain-containing protein [Microbacterium oleivorans]OAH48804.1 hypothetical protein AYL44_12260 [Microbacterium oleivorans]